MAADLACRSTAVWLAALVMTACSPPAEAPPEGHLLIAIETDAPLPSSDGTTRGVFDSLHLEVLRPDGALACDDCVREVGVTREEVQGGATFVIRTEQPALLHARMFFSRLGGGALDGPRVIERWVRLPAAPREGKRSLTVALPLEQVGLPLGSLAEPTEPDETGTHLAPRPQEPAPPRTSPDEVCVDGGWFWMGDSRLPPDGERTANLPQLVHVAPFCVDAHEVTVSELRASGADTSGVVQWSGNRSSANLASFCAFTSSPGAHEDRAVNCVGWEVAREACQNRSMDLPSEAQLEYLGTAFGRSSFVWGEELPSCSEAIVARTVSPLVGDSACARGVREASLPATAVELTTTRDVLTAPGGVVVGLASNLTEWTREAFEPRTASCRRGAEAGPASDPECPASASTTRIAVRGGSLTSTPAQAAAALRAFVPIMTLRADLGFRCVR